MALSDTISAIECVPICAETRYMSEPAFLAILIDHLLNSAGIAISEITAADILSTNETAICELEDRTVFSTVSPEQQRAIVIRLLSATP